MNGHDRASALLERSYVADEVRGVLGGQILRLMEQIDAVAEHR